ncbi:hypothetical protein AMATHDRAFT_93514, partial [Amanita thiersii Skay4041]
IDFDTLTTLVPETDLSNPNSDVIVSIYRLLVAQAADLNVTQRELEETRAEAEKKEVELDQALQDRESMSKELESSLETTQGELGNLKRERDELG